MANFFSKLKNKIKNFSPKQLQVSFVDGMQKLETSGKSFFVIIISAIILMAFVCLAVFFLTVRGPEKVLVPEVEGSELTEALLKMQVKELYPKIQRRYDEKPAGTVLSQSPNPGSIVKAGTRVTLTVSRGAVVTEVGSYVGQNYDNVKIDLATMFTGATRPLIVLADPVYKADTSDAGTILEQDPPAGTKISEPVTVNLIISRGPNYDNTRIPRYVGKSIQEMLNLLPASKLVIDFTSHKAQKDEKEGVIVSQQEIDKEFVPNYSRISVEFTIPQKVDEDESWGIFETTLAEYPYPVAMTVECLEPNGQRTVLTSMNHTGGKFTVPYCVETGSELILKVAGKEVKRITVQ